MAMLISTWASVPSSYCDSAEFTYVSEYVHSGKLWCNHWEILRQLAKVNQRLISAGLVDMKGHALVGSSLLGVPTHHGSSYIGMHI